MELDAKRPISAMNSAGSISGDTRAIARRPPAPCSFRDAQAVGFHPLSALTGRGCKREAWALMGSSDEKCYEALTNEPTKNPRRSRGLTREVFSLELGGTTRGFG